MTVFLLFKLIYNFRFFLLDKIGLLKVGIVHFYKFVMLNFFVVLAYWRDFLKIKSSKWWFDTEKRLLVLFAPPRKKRPHLETNFSSRPHKCVTRFHRNSAKEQAEPNYFRQKRKDGCHHRGIKFDQFSFLNHGKSLPKR